MLNRDFANTTANVGLGALQKANVVGNNRDLGQAIANGLGSWNDFSKKQAYINALQGGDQEEINKTWADYDPDGYAKYMQNKEANQTDFDNKLSLMDKQNQYAIGLENLRNANARGLAQFKSNLAGSDGYGSTPIGLALAINQNPDKFKPEAISWANEYLAKGDPDSMYTAAYQKSKGKEDAKNAVESVVNQRQLANQIQNIDDAMDYVNNAPAELFTPLSSVYNTLGTISRDNLGINNVGFSEDQQNMYGTAETLIKSVAQDLLQEARSKGQTGINTMAEIENAARGLNMSKGKPAVIGALNTLRNIKQKLDNMPTVATPVPSQGLGSFVQQKENSNSYVTSGGYTVEVE